jgi:hypothetical protein
MKKARMTPTEFWASLDKSGECWEWQGSRTTGYGGGYGIAPVNDYGSNQAHRVAYLIAYGPIPPKMVVRHRCDNKACCNPDHLELGTHRDNAIDVYVREQPSAARLTIAAVQDIRAQREAGTATVTELAAKYKVSVNTIRCAAKRQTWKFI